jgi:carbon-monoxide dehydrogenase medium subunit
VFRACSDPRWLAGGMTLLPAMKLRLTAPSDLVELGAVAELRGIRAEAGRVVVGAMTSHAVVAGSPHVKQRIAALSVLAAGIGDTQVRHRGTLGGSISNNDPAADYPAAVLGLGATITTTKREIAADDFFTGLFETALDDDEVVTSVDFPVPERAGYVKFPNPASRYAIVGVMVARTGGAVRVAVTGAGPCAFRAAAMEKALGEEFVPEALTGIDLGRDDLNEDIHASADYRAHLIGVMARRAVLAALEVTGDGQEDR